MSAQQMNAKVICVFNEKGGSGKTTTACQLAGTLGLRGYQVLVADLDVQETASQWLTANGGANLKAQLWAGHRYGQNVVSQVAEFSTKFEIIVADCAPSVEQKTTWGMLLVADLALIPAKLSPPDMAALVNAKRLSRKALEACDRKYPVRVVANATRMHMSDDKHFMSVLKNDEEFPVLKASLGDRKAFSRSMLNGSTAHTLPNSEEAVRELEALADETLALLALRKIRGIK